MVQSEIPFQQSTPLGFNEARPRPAGRIFDSGLAGMKSFSCSREKGGKYHGADFSTSFQPGQTRGAPQNIHRSKQNRKQRGIARQKPTPIAIASYDLHDRGEPETLNPKHSLDHCRQRPIHTDLECYHLPVCWMPGIQGFVVGMYTGLLA